jgi:hypothetical protein
MKEYYTKTSGPEYKPYCCWKYREVDTQCGVRPIAGKVNGKPFCAEHLARLELANDQLNFMEENENDN